MNTKEKQTAVEWLVSRLNKEGFAPVVTQEEIEQAKAVEKEQIEDTVVEYIKSVSKEMGIPIKKISISYDEKLTIRVSGKF
jgi:adenylosuccinate synthase